MRAAHHSGEPRQRQPHTIQTPASSVNGLVHHFTSKYEPVSFMLYI